MAPKDPYRGSPRVQELCIFVVAQQPPKCGLLVLDGFGRDLFNLFSSNDSITAQPPGRMFQSDIYDMGFTSTTTSTTTIMFSMVRILPSVSLTLEVVILQMASWLCPCETQASLV